ncbi:hypothetical protein F751_2185 [Auxenochlorella protothecoides]|nr:hypothetical protein F751_2185 [Auxenochlorella protothecoides]KFM26598.1 hypothetical protein F751_2185 [Auxenochlorella protothecoides]
MNVPGSPSPFMGSGSMAYSLAPSASPHSVLSLPHRPMGSYPTWSESEWGPSRDPSQAQAQHSISSRLSHEEDPKEEGQQQPCVFFLRTGTCAYGAR